MPYGIRKQGNQYCVYNQDTSKTVPGGCHSNEDNAKDHMSALYANVPDAKEKKSAGEKVTKSVKSHSSQNSSGVKATDYRWKGR